MNETVRTYLIETAKQKDKFVYYSEVVKDCNLQIDTSTDYGRKQLSDILGEVSAFENSQKSSRPLLSALAIYKDKSKNDHGDGFYKIAAKLGKGNAKLLKEQVYGFTEAQRCREFWQKEKNLQNFAILNPYKQKSIADLFTKLTESEKFSWAINWKNKYLTFIKEINKLQVALISYPMLQIDDASLYSGLSESVSNYHRFMRKWLKEKANGISSRGQSILSEDNFDSIIGNNTFKMIAKALILEPNLENYNALNEWWFGNNRINNRPLLINRAIAACSPETLSSTVHNAKFWKVIEIIEKSYNFKFEREHNYNWFIANEQLTKWLDVELEDILNKKTSDILQQQVWRNIFVWLIFEEFNSMLSVPNSLIKKDMPKSGYISFPKVERKFDGIDVDYVSKAKDNKDLGDAGEELVKQYEIDCLRKRGMIQKSLEVEIVNDGKGYDVLSFDNFGNEKYIEVKTTTGKNLNPFYLSENEVAFMRTNINSYSIYRVYNYDEENNSGEFFEIKGDVENKILMKPIQYKVLIKKT